MTDLAFMTIAEASRLIRARKLSPVELTAALLARIAALDGIYHAYIAVTAETALAQAKAAEAEIAAGAWRGPLHGVPYALKDIFDVAGMATTCHSKLRMSHRAAADATVVTRLREAGASLLRCDPVRRATPAGRAACRTKPCVAWAEKGPCRCREARKYAGQTSWIVEHS
jgi:aspartyl-tRNA(Asn)/glutamyl-tRNA(Gln) amidotransferase subunit A